MDGGGMRGRNLLVIAEATELPKEMAAGCRILSSARRPCAPQEMELQTGKPLSSLFELVAGTTTGGCGALVVSIR